MSLRGFAGQEETAPIQQDIIPDRKKENPYSYSGHPRCWKDEEVSSFILNPDSGKQEALIPCVLESGSRRLHRSLERLVANVGNPIKLTVVEHKKFVQLERGDLWIIAATPSHPYAQSLVRFGPQAVSSLLKHVLNGTEPLSEDTLLWAAFVVRAIYGRAAIDVCSLYASTNPPKNSENLAVFFLNIYEEQSLPPELDLFKDALLSGVPLGTTKTQATIRLLRLLRENYGSELGPKAVKLAVVLRLHVDPNAPTPPPTDENERQRELIRWLKGDEVKKFLASNSQP